MFISGEWSESVTLTVKASGQCWSFPLWEWVVMWEHWDFWPWFQWTWHFKSCFGMKSGALSEGTRKYLVSLAAVSGLTRVKVILGTRTPVLGQELLYLDRSAYSMQGRALGPVTRFETWAEQLGWSLHSLGSDMFICNQHVLVKNLLCVRHWALYPGFLLTNPPASCALLSFNKDNSLDLSWTWFFPLPRGYI